MIRPKFHVPYWDIQFIKYFIMVSPPFFTSSAEIPLFPGLFPFFISFVTVLTSENVGNGTCSNSTSFVIGHISIVPFLFYCPLQYVFHLSITLLVSLSTSLFSYLVTSIRGLRFLVNILAP